MDEHKKILYGVFGLAVLIHLGFILSKWVAIAFGLSGILLLLFALYKATQGQRIGMSTAFIVSLVGHGSVFGYYYFFGAAFEEEKERLLRFEAPPPILQKNFDLAKRPEISEVQMEMLASLAPPDMPQDLTAIADVSAVGSDLLGAVLPGTQTLGAFSGAKAEELSFDQVEMVELTETATPVQEAISLGQALMDVDDLDIGRYQAVVIQDPEDKKNIRGYFNMTIVDYDVADKNRDRFPTAAEELMRYMRDHTKIKARIEGTTLEFSDPKILDAPFLYMTGHDAIFQISNTEKLNLGDYLKTGGFLYADDIRQSENCDDKLNTRSPGVEGTPFDRQFKGLMKDPLVLGGDGSKWQKIPKNHALYESFWNFPDGPPMGGAPGGNVFDLEMLELRGRIVVVFSDLNLSWYWGDTCADSERERGLQFGVNLIVYALTQPGGIANVSQFSK